MKGKNLVCKDFSLEAKKQKFTEVLGLKIDNLYPKNTFCSGVLSRNVVIESDNTIYIVTDDLQIKKLDRNSNTWHLVEEGGL